MTIVIDPHEEQLKAGLYITLRRLGISKDMYMNWNYIPMADGVYAYAKFVGDTRWNQ